MVKVLVGAYRRLSYNDQMHFKTRTTFSGSENSVYCYENQLIELYTTYGTKSWSYQRRIKHIENLFLASYSSFERVFAQSMYFICY